MRVAAAAALFTLIPVLASAQTRAGTLPPIGLPLPEIGLPLPSLGLAPPARPTPIERMVQGDPRQGRTDGPQRHRRRLGLGSYWNGVVYLVPAYAGIDTAGSPTPGTIVAAPAGAPSAAAAPSSATRRPEPEPAPPSPEPSASVVGPEPPAAVPAPIPRKPFYFIQGCYLGDVPPADAKLPASCDPAKATIFWP